LSKRRRQKKKLRKEMKRLVKRRKICAKRKREAGPLRVASKAEEITSIGVVLQKRLRS